LSLDYLKSARVKREEYTGPWLPEPVLTENALPGPAESAEQREQVSLAFLTLLERLTPDQRVVYVLREAFELPYEEIAIHLGKPAATCRQIHRRANLRLTDIEAAGPPAGSAPPPGLIERFLGAFSSGDTGTLAALLADDVEWISDAGPRRLAARRVITGVDQVSRGLAGIGRKWTQEIGRDWELADINGSPAIVTLLEGRVERVSFIEMRGDRVGRLVNLLNPGKLEHLAASMGRQVAVISDRRAIPLAART
jgi:RNA polymerase sigma-70 factor (ECF subfamily)